MTLQINPNEAKKRINEFLDKISELLDKKYFNGEDEKRRLSTKLDNFAKVAFSDGKEKKDSLHPSVVSATMGRKSEKEKQKEYQESLKRKERHLEAWLQQIELEEDPDSNSGTTDEQFVEVEKEVSRVYERLPVYADDLNKSIDELRNDHYLASAMITGRVIDHTIDQIKSSKGLGGPEEVLGHLEKNDIIDSRENKITDSVKSYRDVYAHEVGQTPGLNEALIILLGCAKLLHNIQEAGKTIEYDLA